MTLEAREVSQSIGKRCLFENLCMTARPGTITAVVGPNGSGKSTLLRRLAGLEPPDRGEIVLEGRAVLDMPPRERALRLGYLPQSTPLYHDLRVRELVDLGRAPHLGRFSSPGVEDRAAVDRALERVGMRELEARGLFGLSGGERQRVMLARMLATGAPVLVLDEPTTGLDVGHALGFLELCGELASGGSTLIIAMHDLARARDYAEQAVCLGYEGGRVETGPAATILEPSTLGELFGVDVAEETQLVFRPRR